MPPDFSIHDYRIDAGAPTPEQRLATPPLSVENRFLLRSKIRKNLDHTLRRFAELSLQLKPALIAGKYTGIVWDDTAGRLLGLGYHELAGLVAHENGRPIPFGMGTMAGKLLDSSDYGELRRPEAEVAEDIAAVSAGLGNSVLVTTNMVNSSRTLRKIAAAITRQGKNFDVLLDGPTHRGEFRQKVARYAGGQVYHPVTYEGGEPWELAYLVAARGLDIDLTSPKFEHVGRWLPEIAVQGQAFLAGEARRQISVVANVLHQEVFHRGEETPRRIAQAAGRALDTHAAKDQDLRR